MLLVGLEKSGRVDAALLFTVNYSTAMSSAAVPPPESPFEARPAPSVISDSASASAATPSDGVYAAKPIPVEFPLTSFSSTPHNVAAFAFLLGACWSLGLVLAGANLSHWFLWNPKSLEHAASDLPKQGLWYAVTHSPQLGMYLASWAVFHTLEFVVTSMYNPGKLTVSCTYYTLDCTRVPSQLTSHVCPAYLLDNGKQYPLAHLAGMLEHVLEDAFLPAEYRRWKHVGGLFLLGECSERRPALKSSLGADQILRLRRSGHHGLWPVPALVRHDQREQQLFAPVRLSRHRLAGCSAPLLLTANHFLAASPTASDRVTSS